MFLCAIQKVYVSRFSIIPVVFNYYTSNDNSFIYQTDVENCEIVLQTISNFPQTYKLFNTKKNNEEVILTRRIR